MNRLSDWLYKVSLGWVVILSLVVTLVFMAAVVPRQAKNAERYSGGVGSPDLSLFYTPDKLYQMARAYGDEGRDYFIRMRFTFDVAWPILYTIFLCTSISWVFQRTLTPESRVWRGNIIPLLAGSFDFFENVCTSIVMFRFPSQTPIAATMAPFFTFIKWAFVAGSFLLLLFGLLLLIWQWFGRKTSNL